MLPYFLYFENARVGKSDVGEIVGVEPHESTSTWKARYLSGLATPKGKP